jgi:hypothetical protein
MSDSTTSGAPAGWYPAGVGGQERYWDGAMWTDHVRPTATVASPVVEAHTVPSDVSTEVVPAPSASKSWYRRKAIIIPAAVVGGVLVLSTVITAVGVGRAAQTIAEREPVVTEVEEAEDDEPAEVDPAPSAADVTVPATEGMTAKEAQAVLENAGLEVEFSADKGFVIDRDNWTVLGTVPAAGAAAKVGDAVVVNVKKTAEIEQEAAQPPAEPAAPAAPPASAMSLGQQNAVESAKSYLRFTAFSRMGLTQQLTSEYGEGFEPGDAEFAIAYLEQNGLVDWNAEAVESAKSYLNLSSFSRDGLYEQLTSEYGEGFTPDQANYALGQVGY